MLPTPQKVKLVIGAAEGGHLLTAFDHALLAAGIGNLNLVRVSSILPPHCEFFEAFDVPAGSLTPTAYGELCSDVHGETIAAAIGLGFSDEDFGVIMEFTGHCSQAEAEEHVSSMVREAFATRGMELRKTMVKAVEHQVEQCGSVVAAAVLWY